MIMLASDSQYWVGSGWVQIFSLVVGWVGLGQLADRLGWVGSHKMDPWTTLDCTTRCSTEPFHCPVGNSVPLT